MTGAVRNSGRTLSRFTHHTTFHPPSPLAVVCPTHCESAFAIRFPLRYFHSVFIRIRDAFHP